MSLYSAAGLRRGVWYYLSGRAATAVLTLVIQLWLVRVLSIADYGVYATLLAGMDIAIVVAALGLNWAVARYVPEYRISASPLQTRRFIMRLVRYRVAALVTAGSAWLLGAHLILGLVAIEISRTSIFLLAALLVLEGLGMFLCDGVLGALLVQRVVRASYVARQLCWLTLLGFAAWFGAPQTIEIVLAAQLAGSVAWIAIAARGLHADLRCSAAVPIPPQEAVWHEPTPSELWGMSLRIYLSDLLHMATSPQVFILMLQRYVGSEAAAVFGFLRVLMTQLSRYLPATLLFSLIQPMLVASYVEGGMPALARRANLAGKLSLLVLVPILAFLVRGSEPLIDLLSGGRFLNTGILFFVAMLAALPGSQGQLLYTVAVVSGNSALCIIAAIANLSVLPAIWLMIQSGIGVWAAIISMCISNMVVFGVLTASLRIRTNYLPDWTGIFKIISAGMIAGLASMLMPMYKNNWLEILLLGVITASTYVASSWLLRPLSNEERGNINKLVGRRLFAA